MVTACAVWALGIATQVRAQDTRAAVGDGAWAMPAIGRVGVPAVEATGVDFAAYAGYGFTEGVLNNGDSHNRLSGSIAGAVRPTNWLTAALRFDGRYDMHSSSSGPTPGSDNGWVGDPRLLVRAAFDATESLHLGFEVGGWFPGAKAPSVQWDAITVDLNGMLAWTPAASPLTLALNVGFRIDNSANSATDAQQLSRADRLALGVSDFNSIRTGLGVSYRVGRIELLGEYTWDILVGSGAPGATDSPMRVGAGVRVPLDEDRAWWIHGMLDVALSSRATFNDGDKLYPIEPRVGALVGITYRLGGDPERPTEPGELTNVDNTVTPAECTVGATQACSCADGASGTQECLASNASPDSDTPAQVGWGSCTCAAETPVAVTAVAVSGHVRDSNSAPIGDAHVTIVSGATTLQATTAADGSFTIASVPVGNATLSVTADSFQPGTLPLTLATQDMTGADVSLDRAVPGAMVRGRVRSFNGQPLGATIRIESLSREVTANADGQFELEVPPGSYQVSITAAGHETQQRRVTVEEQGVVFLNVDMRRSR
ncbi:MAG: carboxypeptidase regulatory-like domain-containing protein [Sandaracinaceae bacterium]|nr:carboxypeptidase regulatory-like domain-containing protein [Sandaracinaceae bacterium]